MTWRWSASTEYRFQQVMQTSKVESEEHESKLEAGSCQKTGRNIWDRDDKRHERLFIQKEHEGADKKRRDWISLIQEHAAKPAIKNSWMLIWSWRISDIPSQSTSRRCLASWSISQFWIPEASEIRVCSQQKIHVEQIKRILAAAHRMVRLGSTDRHTQVAPISCICNSVTFTQAGSVTLPALSFSFSSLSLMHPLMCCVFKPL